MSKYRKALPQLNGGVFLTDGGLETTLVFLEGVELSHFASFPLIPANPSIFSTCSWYVARIFCDFSSWRK